MRVIEGFKEQAKSPACWYDNHFQCSMVSECGCACHRQDATKTSRRYIGG